MGYISGFWITGDGEDGFWTVGLDSGRGTILDPLPDAIYRSAEEARREAEKLNKKLLDKR